MTKALGNNKDEAKSSERYKYLFEASKHITTLNTGILVFFASLRSGIFTQHAINNYYALVVFGGLIFSTFVSVGTMFLIAHGFTSERLNWTTRLLDSRWGGLIILFEFISFFMALVYLLSASA
jgi:hypothetical protein